MKDEGSLEGVFEISGRTRSSTFIKVRKGEASGKVLDFHEKTFRTSLEASADFELFGLSIWATKAFLVEIKQRDRTQFKFIRSAHYHSEQQCSWNR